MSKFFIFLFFVLFLQIEGKAQRIIGGEMNIIGAKNINYKQYSMFYDTLELTLYSKNVTLTNPIEKVSLYNKTTGRLINELKLNKTDILYELKNDNNLCTSLNGIKIFKQTYRGILSVFSENREQEGAVVVYSNYFREKTIETIEKPQDTQFYIETALKLNEKTEANSPKIILNSVENYLICQNKPFSINVGGKDQDGYALKYSIQAPISGALETENLDYSAYIYRSRPKYSNWAKGFSSSNPMGKANDFKINPNTGIITGFVKEKGLYVFSVKMEQVMPKGKLSGHTIRDVFVYVTDCPTDSKLTKPEIFHNGNKASNFNLCPGEEKILNINTSPDNYIQWKKDDKVLFGGNSDKIKVNEAGQYTVVISSSTECTKAMASEAVQVKVKNLKPQIPLTFNGIPVNWKCLNSQNYTLKLIENQDNFEVEWYHTGINDEYVSPRLVGSGNPYLSNTFGTHVAKFKNTGCGNEEFSDKLFNISMEDNNEFYPNKWGKDTVISFCTNSSAFETGQYSAGFDGKNLLFVPEYTLYRNGIPFKFQLGEQVTYEGEYYFTYGPPGCQKKTNNFYIKHLPGCYGATESFYIPSAFSPNGDDVNDIFELINTRNYPELEISIYNRWGVQVFYDKGNKKSWDGTFKGKSLDSDIYNYVIKTNTYDGGSNLTGTISLLK